MVPDRPKHHRLAAVFYFGEPVLTDERPFACHESDSDTASRRPTSTHQEPRKRLGHFGPSAGRQIGVMARFSLRPSF